MITRPAPQSDDDAFIAEILASPNDDTPRLIYADWLEDQGDHRAEYLRLECEIAGLRKSDSLFIELQPRMEALRKNIDVRWLTALGRTRIANCAVFSYRCPLRWENLRILGEARTRHCDACNRHVHYCQSVDELKFHSRRGDCVAIDSFTKIEQRDIIFDLPRILPPVEDMEMGMIID